MQSSLAGLFAEPLGENRGRRLGWLLAKVDALIIVPFHHFQAAAIAAGARRHRVLDPRGDLFGQLQLGVLHVLALADGLEHKVWERERGRRRSA